MGFVGAPGRPDLVVEVWKLPTGKYSYLWPSDMLDDAGRADQIATVMDAIRSD